MSHEPQIQARAAQPYVAIRRTVTMDGISGAVDEAFPELFGWLAGNGIAVGGAPFIRYLVIDMAAELEIELAVPVGAPARGVAVSGPASPGGQVRGAPAHRALRRPDRQQRRAAAVGTRARGRVRHLGHRPGAGLAEPGRALSHRPLQGARPREVGG